jgi:hypothetical protein
VEYILLWWLGVLHINTVLTLLDVREGRVRRDLADFEPSSQKLSFLPIDNQRSQIIDHRVGIMARLWVCRLGIDFRQR